MFRRNEKTAIESDKELYEIVADHLQNWIDPIRALTAKYPLEKWGMVGFTFGELFADLMLAVSSMVGGAYFNAARTMRSMFEYMVHAAYIAERFPEYPGLVYDTMQHGVADDDFSKVVSERLRVEFQATAEQVEEVTGFKFRMIDYLGFATSEDKSHLRRTYYPLSELAHPSPLQLRKHTEDAFLGVTFFHDKALFHKCAELMDVVMDLVLSVMLTSFPEMTDDLRNQKYVYQSLARLPVTRRLLDMP
jgi:hypothetical protein